MADTTQTNAASAPQPIATPQVQNQTAPVAPATTTTTTTTTTPPTSAVPTVQAPAPAPAPAPTQPVAAPTSAQGLTAQQMGQYAEQLAAQAASERKEAEIQKAVAARPAGTVYDPATGTYKDPLAGTTYVGATTGRLDTQGQEILTATPQSSTSGLRFQEEMTNAVRPTGIAPPSPPPAYTPIMNETTKSTISSGLYGDAESGILSSGEYTLARNDLGNVIKQAENTPLSQALSESESYARSVIEANRAEYNRLQGVLAGSTDDPIAQLFAKRQMHIAEQMQAAVADIHAQADASLKIQAKANVEMMGKARAALNAAGQVGSMVGEGYLAAQLQNNLDALENIKASERKAVNDARIAFENQQDDLAFKQADLIERRRKEANDLLSKNYEIATQMEQMGMQRQQFAAQAKQQEMQMRREGRAAANDFLGAYAKQGFSTEIIPDSVWDTAVQESGGTISREVAKTLYSGSLRDQNSKNAAEYAQNLQNFYNAARLLDPKDTSTILNRPNLDGSFTQIKRADVRMAPDYEAFEITEGGKKYRAYVDKNDPEGKMRKIPIGDDDPHYQYFEDPLTGNTIQFNEATGERKPVFDFGGNPNGSESVVTTDNFLQKQADKNGYTVTHSTGQPAWTSKYVDGAVHQKDGRLKPECGQFVNDITGIGVGDSLQSKVNVTDPSIGTEKNPVHVGDVMVTNESPKYGHVAVVNKIEYLADGRIKYTLTESNYKKNDKGQGIITNTREIFSDSSAIKGFGRGPRNPARDYRGQLMPSDNKMAWKFTPPKNKPVETHVKNGIIEDITSDKPASGPEYYTVTVRDRDTNMLHVFRGIDASDLRKGEAWSNTQKPPQIGTGGEDGVTQELRNSDGSPVSPTGEIDTNKYGTWGNLPAIPNSKLGNVARTELERIRNDLERGVTTMDEAVRDLKADPILSRVKSDVLLPSLAGRAKIFQEMKKEKAEMKRQINQQRVDQNNINIGLKMQDDFNANPNVKAQAIFKRQRAIVTPAINILNNKAKTGEKITGEDQAIINTFQKLLDPETGIKEAEYDRLPKGQALVDELRGRFNKLGTGGAGMTTEFLQGTVSLMNTFFDGMDAIYNEEVEDAIDKARRADVDPGLVVGSRNLKPVFAIGPDAMMYEVTPDDPNYLDAFLDGRFSSFE